MMGAAGPCTAALAAQIRSVLAVIALIQLQAARPALARRWVTSAEATATVAAGQCFADPAAMVPVRPVTVFLTRPARRRAAPS
jgi:hypothetical protein